MHDGIPYDPSQGQGHQIFKVRNSSIFFQFSKSISSDIFNVSWQMTTDSETMEQYLNFVRTKFLISVLVFVSRDFELGRVSVQFMLLQLKLYSLGGGGVRSRPSDPYGANFYILHFLVSYF